MLLGAPNLRSINPARSRVEIIWWTEIAVPLVIVMRGSTSVGRCILFLDG
jgi:hypothetical protein